MAGLDFSKLSNKSVADTATEPRRIFTALPGREAKYSRPWDVQSQVWDRWHARRTDPDLLVKMNTGGGKTVVGLIMLKSCLNEGVGPAVFLTPDKYLADQVRAEANALGIETVDDPRAARFLSGKAVLVTYIHRLINGLSVFGVVGDSRPTIAIGSLLVDDTHACVATLEDQFTLTIKRDHPAYNPLVELFDDALRAQSPSAFRDLLENQVGVALRVPYWSWADRQEQVLDILHQQRDSDDVKFVWPLIREVLHLCDAAVSYREVELKPPCPPIDRIPSLLGAKRRIYLTATLADDSVLVTHFGADPNTIGTLITPETADDLGDRMILTPLETHPNTSDVGVQEFLVKQSKVHNVVVIVPSRRRAQFWSDVADAVHDSSSIHDGVRALREGRVGLVVLINKYDGIDLPGDACRILALDGLPEAYGALDQIEAIALDETDAMITRQIQRIEQGMGRGVRSSDDFCVVLLLGSRLTQRLHQAGGADRFSPATSAQLILSDEVANMLYGKPFSQIAAVIDQCLQRDAGWVSASRDAVDGVRYPTSGTVSDIATAQRESFKLAQLGRYRDAHDRMRPAMQATDGDVRYRGWLKQRAAGYLHHADPSSAQQLQRSAQQDNSALLRPREGVAYHRLSSIGDQARQASEYLSAQYQDGNKLIIGVAAILEDLHPSPDQAATARFEQAMLDLGLHLGLGAQRPERDTGEGPDDLWSLGDLAYLVIECKSGVTTDVIYRHDVEQLSHSMDWFAEKYDQSSSATPILIHKSAVLHQKASARPGTQIITFDRLAELRDAVTKWAAALGDNNAFRNANDVARQLAGRHLNAKQLVQHWGTPVQKP